MLKTVTNLINASQIQTPITLPGNVTLSTGNLVIGTSGKGIDFSATPGTGTSELLSDYEEGTWTPTNASAITVNSAKYVRIGSQVICWFNITVGGSATTSDMGGLPFTVTSSPPGGGVVFFHTENTTETWTIYANASLTTWNFRLGSAQKQFSAGKTCIGCIQYTV